jgi:methylenetetrahydrofolate reductase (NADPH)
MRSHVPGVVIPEQVIRRLAALPEPKQPEEGKHICIEIINEVKEIKGVQGVHIMAYRNEELTTEIIAKAGLLPRPAFSATPSSETMQP